MRPDLDNLGSRFGFNGNGNAVSATHLAQRRRHFTGYILDAFCFWPPGSTNAYRIVKPC
jgi:hypothetical protein